MNTRPRSFSVALVLVLLNALLWLTFGILVATDIHPALPISPLLKGIMAVLAFVTAGILLILLLLLTKQNRIAYFFTVGMQIVISLVTIFDDFGWADFIFIVISLAPIVLLVKDRAWYFRTTSGSAGDQGAT
jgi:hypothetical protein